MATSTAIMMSDTVRKDVVYSTECFDQSCMPLDASTQILVEYSAIALEANVMALEKRVMASGDWHDVRRSIDGTIDIVNGCMKVGAFAFPPAAPVLMGIAAVGGYIQKVMKWIPDNRPDPVVEKFKELENVIHKLEVQMAVHFADMQSFISEHNFNINISTQASTLMRFMRNCLQYQDELDVENFTKAYNQSSPLSLAYSMASLLENRSTNPLIVAMAKEQGKTKATFNKWKTIITGILGELLFIETFASGLLNKSDFNRDRIVEQWNDLAKSLEQWEEEYKKDQGYWEELKGFLEPFVVNHTHLNNLQKVVELEKKINSFMTSEFLYVCVFKESTWETDYFYICPNEKDQLIGAWKKGGCNCFIYRSRQGGFANQEAYDALITKVGYGKLNWHGNLKNTVQNELVEKKQLRGNGFIGLFLERVESAMGYTTIRGVNHGGPGICTENDLDGGRGRCTVLVAVP